MTIFKSIIGGTFKTQKASGLKATDKVLEAMGEYHRANMTYGDIHDAAVASASRILANPKDAEEELRVGRGHTRPTFPFFARPCPTVPRHGFVDSRTVVDFADLLTMCADAVAADKDAEIIIMQQLDGDASAVLTANSVAIGPGNDGATSGRSIILYGPLFANSTSHKQLIKRAKIADGDVPYVEAVEQAGRWSLVQVRGGPPVPVCEDYIPAPVTVKVVLVARHDYDLLQWEKDVAAGAKKAGFVVDASSMTLTSHFAVHAVVNKVPVLTSRAPVVGDKLEPAGVDWKAEDYKRLADQINQVDYMLSNPGTSSLIDNNALAQLAIGALHMAGQPVPATEAQLRLTAFGVVGAVKLMSMACIGEARHLHSNSRGVRICRAHRHDVKINKAQVSASLAVMQQMTKTVRSRGRDAYYDMGKRIPLAALGSIMYPVGLIFRDVNWDSAYGGEAWAGIVSGCRSMIRALQQFSKRPDAQSWARVVEHWNEAIHREHNGHAPALSKFNVSKHDMDTLAEVPLACITSLSLTDAWRLFGDPFNEIMAKVSDGVVMPIHKEISLPDGLEIPGEREREGRPQQSILKGQVMLRGGSSSAMTLAVSKVEGFKDIPSECHGFMIGGLFAKGTEERIIQLLQEYGGRLPVSACLTSTSKGTSGAMARRFAKHIKTMMFFARIDKLELPSTVVTSLNVLTLQVGVGTGFKTCVAKDGMKLWKGTVTPAHHSDGDDGDDHRGDFDYDSNGDRLDW